MSDTSAEAKARLDAVIGLLKSRDGKVPLPLGPNELHYLTGVLTADSDTLAGKAKALRLYTNPQNAREYYIIPPEALTDVDPQPWSPAATDEHGPAGGTIGNRPIYRVFLKSGAEIKQVRESYFRVGQSRPGSLRASGGGCSCSGRHSHGRGGGDEYCFACDSCSSGWATSAYEDHHDAQCVDSCDPDS